MKTSAVYKITNTITGDFYIGSSKDVNHRWRQHKKPSIWNRLPNNKLYQDMQKYGVDKFRFQILTPVMPEYLKQVEQEFIDMLRPTYNNRKAKGMDVEKLKECKKKWRQSEKGKAYNSQLCSYNGETLTLNALRVRFHRSGIPNPTLEAKKYLLDE